MNIFDLTGCSVLITGASAGIGREFSRQLAGRAGSLVLVARRLDRLEELRDELVSLPPEDAAAHLEQAAQRILRDCQKQRQMSKRGIVPGVPDW